MVDREESEKVLCHFWRLLRDHHRVCDCTDVGEKIGDVEESDDPSIDFLARVIEEKLWESSEYIFLIDGELKFLRKGLKKTVAAKMDMTPKKFKTFASSWQKAGMNEKRMPIRSNKREFVYVFEMGNLKKYLQENGYTISQ